MALRAVPDHPKFADLKARLSRPKCVVLGCLEAIWHFTGRFTPQGNIGKYTDQAIEAWVEWDGKPGELISALIDSGWIDRDKEHRLLVHDWSQHADKATKNSLSRAKLSFYSPSVCTEYVQSTYELSNSGNMYRLPVPEPVPVPVPGAGAVPEQKTAPCETTRETLRPVNPDSGEELAAANWLFEELGIGGGFSDRNVAAQEIRILAKQDGTVQLAAEYLLQAGKSAQARGETINRFWFSDKKYQPATPALTPRQRERQAARKAFMEAPL